MNTTEAPDKIYYAPHSDGGFSNFCSDVPFPPDQAQIEYLKATSAAHWVSVKERLPEEGSRFIVTDGALFYLSTYEDGNFWEVGHVSHWLSNVPSIPVEEK